jgi:hypothetical protein
MTASPPMIEAASAGFSRAQLTGRIARLRTRLTDPDRGLLAE